VLWLWQLLAMALPWHPMPACPLLLPACLAGCRVPRFLTHIADQHDPMAVRLICNLLEHGRLRCAIV
jgi:hypothetical protein